MYSFAAAADGKHEPQTVAPSIASQLLDASAVSSGITRRDRRRGHAGVGGDDIRGDGNRKGVREEIPHAGDAVGTSERVVRAWPFTAPTSGQGENRHEARGGGGGVGMVGIGGGVENLEF